MPLFLIFIVILIFSPLAIASHSTVGHVVISEIQIRGAVVNDEFVELLNPTDCPVDLSGWKLTRKTAAGNESNLVASLAGTIPAHGSFLITPQTGYDGVASADALYSQTSNFLADNNTVIIYADQAKTIVVDKAGFGSASDVEGVAATNPSTDGSLERINGQDTDNNSVDFAVRPVSDPGNSQSPPVGSPGTCASPPPPSPPPPPPSPSPAPPPGVAGENILSLSAVRNTPKGQSVKTRGVVSVTPGQLSGSYFYIQDDAAGMQIYSSKKSFPHLTTGDGVEISGTMSEAYNEKRINVGAASDITVLGRETVRVHQKRTGQIGEANEGLLVRVTGTVTQTSGDTFYINDGSGQVKIYIKEETGIDKPPMKKDDLVTVTGIVSQYQDAYRVLPREQDDLAMGGGDDPVEEGAVSGAESVATAAGSSNSEMQDLVTFVPSRLDALQDSLAKQPGWVRSLAWAGIILGSSLIVLVPFLLWAKKSGWSPMRGKRPSIFSKNSPSD